MKDFYLIDELIEFLNTLYNYENLDQIGLNIKSSKIKDNIYIYIIFLNNLKHYTNSVEFIKNFLRE